MNNLEPYFFRIQEPLLGIGIDFPINGFLPHLVDDHRNILAEILTLILLDFANDGIQQF